MTFLCIFFVFNWTLRMPNSRTNSWWDCAERSIYFLNATMFSRPLGCLCISKCQLCETPHRSLTDITHAHTFTFSVAQRSLPWWLWNHSERQPLQNVMSQATRAPTSAARCWNNGITSSAALCPWNPLHLFWQFQLMLKWNGIFLMKFIATVHLLFNMFSVPSALLPVL